MDEQQVAGVAPGHARAVQVDHPPGPLAHRDIGKAGVVIERGAQAVARTERRACAHRSLGEIVREELRFAAVGGFGICSQPLSEGLFPVLVRVVVAVRDVLVDIPGAYSADGAQGRQTLRQHSGRSVQHIAEGRAGGISDRQRELARREAARRRRAVTAGEGNPPH